MATCTSTARYQPFTMPAYRRIPAHRPMSATPYNPPLVATPSFKRALADRRWARAKFHQQRRTLVIVDFDDTMFPTTVYATLSSDEELAQFRKELEPLDDVLCRFFSSILTLDRDVRLLSNGCSFWYEDCLRDYLPKLNELLRDKAMPMWSARDLAPKKLQSALWKPLILSQFQQESDLQQSLNVISLSDSYQDRAAFLEWQSVLPENSLVKSFKFICRPSVAQLIAQFTVLLPAFSWIESTWNPLDLFASLSEAEVVCDESPCCVMAQ